jgi:ABC-type multidrug transport system fused ATPase/permease subunit
MGEDGSAAVEGREHLGDAVEDLGALGWVFNYFRQKISARVIGDVVLRLREDVFTRAVHQDLSFFDQHPSGKIVSRITSDTQDFSNIVTLVVDLLSQFLLVVVLSVWLFSINVWLTFLLLGMAPIAVVIAISFRKLARKVSQQARRVTAKINAQIQESISGIVVAKTFRQEATIYDRFLSNNKQAYRINLQRGIVLNMIFPLLTMVSGVGIGVLVYAGGTAMRGGGMSPGDWYLFMQAVGFYVWPLINIASFWSQFQDGLSAAERVFALIDSEPAVIQTGDEDPGRVQGHIEFTDVVFAYNEKEQVLNGFSLDIPAGQTIAVVGHTGAGKSSLARLINRFYEFQAGDILIDGKDVRSLDLQAYRRNIGFVPQSPFLFSGSVAENIRYERREA